ncbi:hypothetical protein AZI86_10000 [Bdellovibrio bacteriovorus]|uniref:SMP-30/Gluconolactonase/LRE-like region domain-containing protein n=1 Tax=Bdellovibrio bacteriovorus TaxID=959 RepID=A0A150WSA7_BDEBC|nr:hypothetical protein [Bdellovibrio bacteriovorus]KYG67320.1 hypothetical protein AZI86_10000 [Bdellovibrio bacteriovorus]
MRNLIFIMIILITTPAQSFMGMTAMRLGKKAVAVVAGALEFFVGDPDGIGYLDGYRTTARVFFPMKIKVNSGEIFFQDLALSRKVDTAGNVSTLSGTFTADSDIAMSSLSANPEVTMTGEDFAGNKYLLTSYSILKYDGSTFMPFVGSIPGTADGTGTSASFTSLSEMTFDSANNIYVTDNGTRVRKITPAGVVTTIAGSTTAGNAVGVGTAARFAGAKFIAFAAPNYLYVYDEAYTHIKRIDLASSNTVSHFAGPTTTPGFSIVDGTGAAARFMVMMKMKVDPSGNLFVTNYTVLRKITPGAVVTTVAGRIPTSNLAYKDGTGTAAEFGLIQDFDFDTNGDIYVADFGAIRKVTSAGVVTTFVGHPPNRGMLNANGTAAKFLDINSIAAIGGNIYIADTMNNLIRRSNSSGVVTTFAGSGDSGSDNGTGSAATFDGPYSMTFDNSGNLYVYDSVSYRMRKISPSAVVSTIAGGAEGSADGTGAAAQFGSVGSMIADSAGNIYLTMTDYCVVRKITSAGVVSTIAGVASDCSPTNGTGTAAKFGNPKGLAIDSSGNLFISDSWDHTIKKMTLPGGVVTTFAGSSGAAGINDGTGASARFTEPGAMVIDPATNNLYVFDSGSGLLRKITPAGVVTTVLGTSNVIKNQTGATPTLGMVTSMTISGGKLYLAANYGVMRINLP